MWISRQINNEQRDIPDVAEVGKVTIGGGVNVGVMTDREARNVSLFSPGGYYWHPAVGNGLLILKCGDGYRVAVGEPQGKAPIKMESGEVYITSAGGAALHLRNDGSADIIGRLLNNGKPLSTESEGEA